MLGNIITLSSSVTYLTGLPFLSKDNENGRNEKINDHKSHHEDAAENQKGAQDRVESNDLGRQ